MAVTPPARERMESQLIEWAGRLDASDLQWASGYLAGLAAARDGATPPHPEPSAATVASPATVIWYGSETGNGRGVAERLTETLRGNGMGVELVNTADIQPRSIAKIRRLVLVMSTHGEGDPPEDAEELYRFLQSERAPRLEALEFAVFALGDSSYPDFCRTGRDLDARLEALGARRIMERVDVDVDFESAEDAWRRDIVGKLRRKCDDGVAPTPHLQIIGGGAASRRVDRRNPFSSEVLDVAPLTVAPSTSPVHHVELLVADSGMRWQPGDSLGILPRNDARLVDEILEVTGIDSSTVVTRGADSLQVREWLEHRLELTRVVRPFLEAWSGFSDSDRLRRLLNDHDALAAWSRTRQVVDVLREVPAAVDADALVGSLRAIAPRLYSIASSPLAHDDEIHLTVKRIGDIDAHGRLRAGVASWQLTSSLTAGDALPVHVEENPRFRLPEDPDAPILMIGPGTGVAPFRAFVQHRHAAGDRGANWLFFGARNRRTDFLYQLEWQRFQRQGALARLSVAFSRDQADRIYVQHRLREQGREVWQWLDDGAHVYVCGDGGAMALDVHRALLDIAAEHGGLGKEEAQEYLDGLKRNKRYQKDVY